MLASLIIFIIVYFFGYLLIEEFNGGVNNFNPSNRKFLLILLGLSMLGLVLALIYHIVFADMVNDWMYNQLLELQK